jgi:putative ABC transport system substrate-binding protein
MRRRDFIALLSGSAAGWPLAARAQQPAIPVVGYLSPGSPDSDVPRLTAFQQGLNQTGYLEGRTVAIEYRWMQGHYDLLPALLADFLRRPVTVIVAAGTTPGALAAKKATATIPIVFEVGADPIDSGLVASLNRPGGNLTGIFSLGSPLAAKRLELLHELVPSASVLAYLANPSSVAFTASEMIEVRKAAKSLGLELHVLNASTAGEIDAAFVTFAQPRAGAFLISGESFLTSRREQIIALAAHHAVPTIYNQREWTTAGGLMSYGFDGLGHYRQIGIYVGRILNGEKPADLPVQQSTKIELVINLKAAKALGIKVPITLLGRADEVIE